MEALAQLSFMKSLGLNPAGRLCLARQLVKQCRGAVEAAETFDVHDLEVGLGGLANLARSDSGRPRRIGTLFKHCWKIS